MPVAKVKRKVNIKLPTKIKGHKRVKVGFIQGTNQDIINRAIWNNFGTEEEVRLVDGSLSPSEVIPERPFMDNALLDNRKKYKREMKKAARKIMKGKLSTGLVVNRIGILAKGDIQLEIINLKAPKNADSTIEKKGSDNPLVDSGEMGNSVEYQTFD